MKVEEWKYVFIGYTNIHHWEWEAVKKGKVLSFLNLNLVSNSFPIFCAIGKIVIKHFSFIFASVCYTVPNDLLLWIISLYYYYFNYYYIYYYFTLSIIPPALRMHWNFYIQCRYILNKILESTPLVCLHLCICQVPTSVIVN